MERGLKVSNMVSQNNKINQHFTNREINKQLQKKFFCYMYTEGLGVDPPHATPDLNDKRKFKEGVMWFLQRKTWSVKFFWQY